ncbi:MAG: lamin tail domain-containing protein [Candidatus Paceibacterota bacterium]
MISKKRKKNKISYKKLSTSLLKVARKTKKFAIFYLKKSGLISQKIKKQYAHHKTLLPKFSPIALILIIGIVFLNVPLTNAYLSDEESSTNNMSAGTLGISLEDSNVYTSNPMYSDESTSTVISILNIGSVNSQYTASSTLVGSDNSVCDYVTMTATTASSSYTGAIKDFKSVATTTNNTVWNFSFKIKPNIPPNIWGKTCYFKWTYTAWQNDLSDPSYGFSDVKEKLGSIRIGQAIVLNEFLPNPVGNDNAHMPGGEWVEIYNNSNQEYDLAGWYLYDKIDTHELPIVGSRTNTGGTKIAPHGFLVVYKNGSSNFTLNNNGDNLRLASGYPLTPSNIVDSYEYTEGKPEGFSFARIPDGIGSWVDPIPTPGGSNKVEDNNLNLKASLTNTSSELVNLLIPETTTSQNQTTLNILENVIEITNEVLPVIESEPVVEIPTFQEEPEIVLESSVSEQAINESETIIEADPVTEVTEPVSVTETETTIDPISITEPATVSITEPVPAIEPEPIIVEVPVSDTPSN